MLAYEFRGLALIAAWLPVIQAAALPGTTSTSSTTSAAGSITSAASSTESAASTVTATADTVAIASSASAFASKLLSASPTIKAYEKPTQTVEQIIAIGDSFTAGIGSNGPGDYISSSVDCGRYQEAYPFQIQNHDGWHNLNGGKAPVLNFGACSGAKTNDMIDHQLNIGDGTWREVEYHDFGKPQLAVTTIGGNDAGFGDLLNACVYRAFRPGDCQEKLNAAREFINGGKLQTNLLDVLSRTAIVGQRAGGAQPPQSFQVYISEYIPFWNHDDTGCNDVSWGWWFWDRPTLTTGLRRQMNNLVDDLNSVIKASAQGLEHLGVFYVEGISGNYDTHRFCEPPPPGAPSDYLQKQDGSRTWFWSPGSRWVAGEGPDNVASSDVVTNYTSAIVQLLIPEHASQLSAEHPPWEFSDAFNSEQQLLAALEQAAAKNATGPNNATTSTFPLSEPTRRQFHPKGTAYGHHADAYMSVIQANRGAVGAAAAPKSSPPAPSCPPIGALCSACPKGTQDHTCFQAGGPNSPMLQCMCADPCGSVVCHDEA